MEKTSHVYLRRDLVSEQYTEITQIHLEGENDSFEEKIEVNLNSEYIEPYYG